MLSGEILKPILSYIYTSLNLFGLNWKHVLLNSYGLALCSLIDVFV
jgi:hypothetical protein